MDTGIAPNNDFESAMIVSLTPGSYTVIVEDATTKTGIGLIEVYDLDQGVTEYLAISAPAVICVAEIT